ncbi:ANR family transcriptional regulator [Serratia marcescens]|uniref:ANR family transcriptional regulator n=3 Tax=Serratia TaxID=613 RepID=UPI0011CAAE1C|nr:ANR family transcriptional regulator [Serratia marcescens]TXE53322.1 ANR family transcriptional regulator [Serratia marcescens]
MRKLPAGLPADRLRDADAFGDDEGAHGGDLSRALSSLQMEAGPREHYRRLTDQAAALERAQLYAPAEELWQQATLLATTHLDADWCEARREWCRRRALSGPPRPR